MRIHRNRDYIYGYNHVHPAVKVLIAVLVITGIAFSLAWVWHTTEQTAIANNQPLESSQAETASAPPESSAPPEEPSPAGISSGTAEETSSKPEETPASIPMEGLVPENAPVDASYFDDAIFLGDSITTGISLYHIADNTAVVAEKGVSPDNVLTKECIKIDEAGNRATVLDAAKAYGPRKKVYIMLGGNGIGTDKNSFITSYNAFLDEVKLQYPDAIIYLQSMTPVVHDYVNEFDPTMNNDKIDAYNLEILALAQREDVYYLDVNSALKDETGALPKEASPVDGLHFMPEYYTKWFDYLKTHTIAVEESDSDV